IGAHIVSYFRAELKRMSRTDPSKNIAEIVVRLPPSARDISDCPVRADRVSNTDARDVDLGNFQMRGIRGITVQLRDAATKFVDLVRAEDVDFGEVAEVSPLVQRAIEIRPDAAGLRGQAGAVEAAVDLVFAGTQLVIEPHTELGSPTEEIRGEADIA